MVDGISASGRRILRGVMRYARTHTPWILAVEMDPLRPKGKEWAWDDGTIYAATDTDLLKRIRRRGRPIVNCLAHHEVPGLPTVRSDDSAVGQMAATYFLERGFERFVFANGSDRSAAANMRLEGFRDTLMQAGATLYVHDTEPYAGRKKYVDQWDDLAEKLKAMVKPVALLCTMDFAGRAASHSIVARGLSVPEQVAIVGVDNDELQCEISRPPLSSVEIPYEDLGYQAAQRLDGLLSNQSPALPPLLIAPREVVTRASSDVVALDEPRMAEALRFIRAHACDPCTVEDVLNHILVSRRWLEEQFRRRFGRSPHSEITKVRIERAKYMLHNPNLTLKQVAARVGYGHVQNFVATFHRTEGITPAVYRRRCLAT